MNAPSPRWHSAAADRNKQAILDVLQRWLPAQGLALEVACGSGQHACHFAAGLPGWTWLPTDPDPGALASTAAWVTDAGLANVLAPQPLDVRAEPWKLELPRAPDLVFNANMIHISPWATCGALMRGAAACLAPDGRLILYGPFFVGDAPNAPGNRAFDADLRARNPEWGVRTLDAVLAEAGRAGLHLADSEPMPANNRMLAFRRA